MGCAVSPSRWVGPGASTHASSIPIVGSEPLGQTPPARKRCLGLRKKPPRNGRFTGLGGDGKAASWLAGVENVRFQHHSLRHRPERAPFSAATGAVIFGLSCKHLGAHLCTARMAESRLRFSDGPGFSGALYFSDLVQSLKNPDCQALTKRRVRNRTRSATVARRNPKRAILNGG